MASYVLPYITSSRADRCRLPRLSVTAAKIKRMLQAMCSYVMPYELSYGMPCAVPHLCRSPQALCDTHERAAEYGWRDRVNALRHALRTASYLQMAAAIVRMPQKVSRLQAALAAWTWSH